MEKITIYSEFWPFYLREHSQKSTRGWHYLGTGIALIMLAALIITANWLFLPLMFICGYFFAWMSHGLIEKNKPATFTYPLWSLFSDFKMLFCALTGQMRGELAKAGVSDSSNVINANMPSHDTLPSHNTSPSHDTSPSEAAQ